MSLSSQTKAQQDLTSNYLVCPNRIPRKIQKLKAIKTIDKIVDRKLDELIHQMSHRSISNDEWSTAAGHWFELRKILTGDFE